MGDITTHAQISRFVAKQVAAALRTPMVPKPDFTYLELGNFLTDVSQFRDPPAFHKGREEARRVALAEAGVLAGPVGVDEWADAMFGVRSTTKAGRRGALHGQLPEFLRLLASSFTHQVFDHDGLVKVAREQVDELARGAGAPGLAGRVSASRSRLMPDHSLDPAEVDRVLAARFTQYWPHEHVDFPPMRDPARHGSEPMFGRGRGPGMIAYLTTDQRYLAEELARLELDWATAQARLTQQQRRDFLTRLGNLLHAVEDFFFHSNLVELRQWQYLLKATRKADPVSPEGRERLFRNGLRDVPEPDDLGPDERERVLVRLRRQLFRRLRYPVHDRRGDPDRTLSLETSLDATDLLYTGGFGSTEVLHTLGSALESMGQESWMLGPGDDPAKSHLVLVRLLFSEPARAEVVRAGATPELRAKVLKELLAEHAKQLGAGEYATSVADLRAREKLSQRAADLMDQAFGLDRRSEEAYQFLPGPGGVVITLLDRMQRERQESARSARSFDATETSITIPRSANDASAEDVGSHTLLGKDSASKLPLRDDALALAMHASAAVATLLVTRLERRLPVTQGVDWAAVLALYVRFPKHPAARWEEQLITALRRDGEGFEQPDLDAVRDRYGLAPLGPANQPGRLDALRNGRMLPDGTRKRTGDELQDYYREFESDPPSS